MPDMPPTPDQEDQIGQRKRFGRLKRFDPESLDYPLRRRLSIVGTLLAKIKTHVNHRVMWQGNQSNTSQCGAYSLLHAWEADAGHPRGAKYPLHGYPRPIFPPAALYDLAQQDDEWPGSEKVAPFYEGTSGTGAANAALSLGLITRFDSEFSDIEVCARAIFTAPLVFGIDWKIGMMLDGGQRSRWEDAVVHPTGSTVGGHLIACVGYDKRRKGAEFEFLNSWGRTWGMEGRCFIGKDDLGTLLADQGECVMMTPADDKSVAAAMDGRLGR